MIRLYMNVYRDKHEERAKELQEVFIRNLFSEHIGSIHVIVHPDDAQMLSNFAFYGKLKIHQIPGRPTYQNFFDLINEVSEDLDVNVIVNSDIFVDETILQVEKIRENDCFALSRWEIKPDGTPNFVQVQIRNDSQDTWCFRGKIKPIEYCDFTLGKPGCDNRIAYEIQRAGYNVTNPSKTIKTWHLHNSGIRHYIHKIEHCVPAPYLTIPLTYLP